MRPQMGVEGVAHRVGRPVAWRDRHARPGRSHARRHRCGPRPGCARARPRSARWRVLDRLPARTGRSPGAASRTNGAAVIFDDELVARHQAEPSRRPAAGDAAQEIVGRHAALAGALDLQQPHRAVAAGDGQRVVEHVRPGAPRAIDSVVRSTFTRSGPLPRSAIEERAGERRQAADVVVHALRRPRPVDPRLLVVDLVRVGDALRRLRREAERRRATAPPAPAPSGRRRARASRSCSSPAVMSGPIGDALGHARPGRCRAPPPSA